MNNKEKGKSRKEKVKRRFFTFYFLLLPWTGLFADDATSRYFEELRRRRLFVLAESYCVDRLQQERLPPDTRAELTLELSRTFAEHAKFTTGEEQTEYWKRASRTIDDFLKANPRNSQRLRLEVQGALIPAAQGEFLRWQSELFPDSTQRITSSCFALLKPSNPKNAFIAAIRCGRAP